MKDTFPFPINDLTEVTRFITEHALDNVDVGDIEPTDVVISMQATDFSYGTLDGWVESTRGDAVYEPEHSHGAIQAYGIAYNNNNRTYEPFRVNENVVEALSRLLAEAMLPAQAAQGFVAVAFSTGEHVSSATRIFFVGDGANDVLLPITDGGITRSNIEPMVGAFRHDELIAAAADNATNVDLVIFD